MKFSDINKKSNNSNFMTIIVIVGAIIIGIIVFAISNSLLSPSSKKNNKDKLKTSVELELDDKNVEKLYKLVSYGNDNIFIKNPNLKLHNFTNFDKFYYSSSLITEDDIKESEDKESGNKLNIIDYSKMKEYIEECFGSDVEFEKDSVVKVVLPFELDGKNTCTLTYNDNLTAYTVGCSENKQAVENNYRELISAKEKNDIITLKERVIYVNLAEDNGRINYDIYKDYNHTILITSDDVDKNNFSLKDIMRENRKKATTITYTFKKDGSNYYFSSSKIND